MVPAVSMIAQRLIGLLDGLLPAQLDSFYLVGSVAQGDYQEGQSDVDFVAVVSPPIEVAALAAAHATLCHDFPDIACDGIYLQPGELSRRPAGKGIVVRDGKIDPSSSEERTPVVWLLLADEGIALRGRVPDMSWIAADRNAAIEYSRANLQSYWRSWMSRATAEGQGLLDDAAVVWGALGVARVHATIVTGRVPSKTAAAAHAMAAFPDHAEIIREALRLRCDPISVSTYTSPLTRRQELVVFVEAVICAGA